MTYLPAGRKLNYLKALIIWPVNSLTAFYYFWIFSWQCSGAQCFITFAVVMSAHSFVFYSASTEKPFHILSLTTRHVLGVYLGNSMTSEGGWGTKGLQCGAGSSRTSAKGSHKISSAETSKLLELPTSLGYVCLVFQNDAHFHYGII